MSKTKDLLEFGYLPLQSPPCFSSQSFADRVVPIRKAFNKAKNSKTLGEYGSGTRPQHFSVARSRHSRRPISIPNPFAQLEIADVIARDWRAIERHCKTSSLSLSTPSFSNADGRAIHITPHTALYEKRLQFSAEARYVLTSDISQFFPSLYTHSIPWALYGKAKAKSQRFNAKLLGNRIDKALQAAQHGQTIGIPIGPDSSHIVAEIVACAIDSRLEKHLHKKILGYRHVDDFVLFFKSFGEAEEALTALEASVRYFELKLNPLKTRIQHLMAWRGEHRLTNRRRQSSKRRDCCFQDTRSRRSRATMQAPGTCARPRSALKKSVERSRRDVRELHRVRYRGTWRRQDPRRLECDRSQAQRGEAPAVYLAGKAAGSPFFAPRRATR